MVWVWGSRRREADAGAMESDSKGSSGLPRAQNTVTLFFPVFVPSFTPFFIQVVKHSPGVIERLIFQALFGAM